MMTDLIYQQQFLGLTVFHPSSYPNLIVYERKYGSCTNDLFWSGEETLNGTTKASADPQTWSSYGDLDLY